jgi:TRAP-type C4-dicarboxylate transport system substrate-binding protein
MQDNYKTIQQKLRNREPFKGNSLTAYWEGQVYKVVSYSTLIAEIGNMGNILISDRKYSVTTSKHQNIIRRAWGIN